MVNLQLTQQQQEVLELELNLASTPNVVPKIDLIARMENLARRIKDKSEAQAFREQMKYHIEEIKTTQT